MNGLRTLPNPMFRRQENGKELCLLCGVEVSARHPGKAMHQSGRAHNARLAETQPKFYSVGAGYAEGVHLNVYETVVAGSVRMAEDLVAGKHAGRGTLRQIGALELRPEAEVRYNGRWAKILKVVGPEGGDADPYADDHEGVVVKIKLEGKSVFLVKPHQLSK
jgi:hypothetical protein